MSEQYKFLNVEQLNSHFDDDEEMIAEILEIFARSYPNSLSGIKAAVESTSAKDLELHAHTLKGMVSNFFAEPLRLASFELEKMGRKGSVEGAAPYIAIVEKGLPELVLEIQSHYSLR